ARYLSQEGDRLILRTTPVGIKSFFRAATLDSGRRIEDTDRGSAVIQTPEGRSAAHASASFEPDPVCRVAGDGRLVVPARPAAAAARRRTGSLRRHPGGRTAHQPGTPGRRRNALDALPRVQGP